METNSILTANILDILFDGRNKEYGAYDLRRSYEKRIAVALGIMIIVILLSVIAASLKNAGEINSAAPIIKDLSTTQVHEEKVIPPPLSKPRERVRTIANPPPIIVEDNRVLKPPPEVRELENAKIDIQTTAGVDDKGISAPIEIKNSQVIEAPVKKSDMEDGIVEFVQIEARFSGNWNAYVQKEIEKNIDELTDAGESGTCIVRFVVSKDGTVSDVEAITMKGSKLAEVAVNAIRRGPKWIPAIQNGRQVNAYRQQPITFRITD